MWRILWGIWRRLWVRNRGWRAPDFCPGLCVFKLNLLGGGFADLLGGFCKKRGAGCGFLCGKDGHLVEERWVVSSFVDVIGSLVLVIELEGRDVWVDGRAGAVAEGSTDVCGAGDSAACDGVG